MKKIKRILKYVFLITLVYFIIIFFSILSYKKELNINPIQPYYKKGVYHIHSLFSDGKGNIDEITTSASLLKLDFVILTDHGEPNLKSTASTSWINNVLLIGGSEFSTNSGHLAAVGYKVPDYIFPPEPQQAINEVNDNNGISFVSHPFDKKIPWTDWDIKDFTGLEVLSIYSCAKRIKFLKLFFLPAQYLFNPIYALLSTINYPEKNIKKWDSINNNGKYYAIYALDAHANLKISKKIQLHIPSYKSMFEILTVYVKINKALSKDPYMSASTIISSLKNGNFFNAIEALSSANGFESYFIQKDGKIFEMGSSSTLSEGNLIIKLPFNFGTDIKIKRNGKLFKRIVSNFKTKLEIEIKNPGVYRTEVFINKNRFNKIPWILTNPFFIGITFPEQKEKNIYIKKLLVKNKNYFKIEHNNKSEGHITYDRTKDNELITNFRFKLEKELNKKDFWSAISIRQRFDFSKYMGFVFDTKSENKIRLWIEFRVKKNGSEQWYSHSFLSDKEWRKINVPFNKFFQIYGEKSSPVLSKINAIFFSINIINAYPGTKGSVKLKNIGLY